LKATKLFHVDPAKINVASGFESVLAISAEAVLTVNVAPAGVLAGFTVFDVNTSVAVKLLNVSCIDCVSVKFSVKSQTTFNVCDVLGSTVILNPSNVTGLVLYVFEDLATPSTYNVNVVLLAKLAHAVTVNAAFVTFTPFHAVVANFISYNVTSVLHAANVAFHKPSVLVTFNVVLAISIVFAAIFHTAAPTGTPFETYSAVVKLLNCKGENFTVQAAVFFIVPYNLTCAVPSIVVEPSNLIAVPFVSVFFGVYVNNELPIFKYTVEKTVSKEFVQFHVRVTSSREIASLVLIVHFNIVTSLHAGYVEDNSTEVSLAKVISHHAIVYVPNAAHASVTVALNSVSSSTTFKSVVLFKENL
jgi:hypothetical protein